MRTTKIIVGLIVFLFVMIGINSCNQKNITQQEKIKIGVVAPLTGPNAKYGDILKQGFDLAFNSDTSIQLQYEDSKFESKTTVTAFNKLISVDNVKIVLGEVASGNTMAIAPIAEKNKIVLFTTISSTDNLKKAGDYFFRNIPSNDVQGKTAAEFIFNKLNIRSVAVFGENSEYGVNITKSFKTRYLELGGEIKYEDSYLGGDKNFKTALAKIKTSDAKALFIPGNENEPADIIKQAKEISLNIPIIGGDGSSTDNLISMAGNSSEGFYCTNVLVDKSTEYYKKYHDLFVSKFNKEPGAYEAYAYEGAKIILEAVQKSGNDADKVKEYLKTHTFQSMTGELKFDKNGQVDRLWGIYQVHNGKFEEVK